MPDTAILGLVAACLTTLAYVPQVLKTWRSKSARDLSLPMFLLFATGVFLWIVYGWLIGDLPIIVANLCTFLLALTLLYFKIHYRK